jgi:hypothetical protein
MGCDIHCYIEHTLGKRDTDTNWWSFGGSINPGRNYGMFSVMAGVRGYDKDPAVPPKGIPDNIAYRTADDYYYEVIPDDSDLSDYRGKNYVTASDAEKWLKYGSRWKDEKKTYISSPDYHSVSWFTLEEYVAAIKEYKKRYKEYGGIGFEYKAILAAMKELNKRQNVRLVFWFDN